MVSRRAEGRACAVNCTARAGASGRAAGVEQADVRFANPADERLQFANRVRRTRSRATACSARWRLQPRDRFAGDDPSGAASWRSHRAGHPAVASLCSANRDVVGADERGSLRSRSPATAMLAGGMSSAAPPAHGEDAAHPRCRPPRRRARSRRRSHQSSPSDSGWIHLLHRLRYESACRPSRAREADPPRASCSETSTPSADARTPRRSAADEERKHDW